MGFPGGLEVMNPPGCRRIWFDPWVGMIPWRRKWQSSLVFLPGKSHGQRSLVSLNPWGHKRIERYLVSKQRQQYLGILFTC